MEIGAIIASIAEYAILVAALNLAARGLHWWPRIIGSIALVISNGDGQIFWHHNTFWGLLP